MGVHDITRTATLPREHRRSIDIDTLMASGIQLASDPLTTNSALSAFVDRMIRLESNMTSMLLTSECGAYSVEVLDAVFERGWQPAELVHVLGRSTVKSAPQMAVSLIAEHARRTRAMSTAPDEWKAQLLELGVDPGTDLARFRAVSSLNPRTFWTSLFRLLASVRRLRDMVEVGPPPSRWGESQPPSQGADAKVLHRIRALLAKAESSTFSAERETFSAKAQELMTEYSIDTAVLSQRGDDPADGVITRRFTVSNPYVDAKMKLLSSVAGPNGVRTVWYKRLGLIAVIGMPVDIELSELLYTSLLVQSAQDLERVGTHSGLRSKGFRRSFLFGYADRIRERLNEARVRAQNSASERYGTALVPLFQKRDQAVASMVDELFPNLKTTRTSMSNTSGWGYGRQAAESADITGGREQLDETEGPR
ncbi:DUF2786 domain-containing protein [Rhodococcoides kyotonense]|uniref:DUF2786 domain-containing protein n=1 Tax=Rhodococcoides kyotonense TaxID=398843 RepID=A0A239IH96_9NOCA|nr:DUF2786 domain-containing protein [Rhodococcus kyotonensis]SNS92977.1 Protein of unknown function [Rhodococcus kyotonensis]